MATKTIPEALGLPANYSDEAFKGVLEVIQETDSVSSAMEVITSRLKIEEFGTDIPWSQYERKLIYAGYLLKVGVDENKEQSMKAIGSALSGILGGSGSPIFGGILGGSPGGLFNGNDDLENLLKDFFKRKMTSSDDEDKDNQ